ncbi:LOW QUALITY PROTEIN: hypothetical protein CRUP_000460, partial [Coryphaenoides rupestris]
MIKFLPAVFFAFVVVVVNISTWEEPRGRQRAAADTSSFSSSDRGRPFYTSSLTTRPDSEHEVHAQTFTTVPPVNAPNHRHVLEGLLLPQQHHLLTRDFRGDQRYFGQNASPRPTVPGSLDDGGDVTPRKPQPTRMSPAFSDVASPAPLPARPTTTTTTTARLPGLAFTTSKPVPMAEDDARGGQPSAAVAKCWGKTWAWSDRKGAVRKEDHASTSPGSAVSPDFHPGQTDSQGTGEKSKSTSGREVIRQPGEEDRTTTTTTITTTTTMQTGPCSLNYTDPEGTIEIRQPSGSVEDLNYTDPEGTIEIRQPSGSVEECDYLVTVYLGYGVELQGEVLSLEDTGGPGPSLLANESVLMRGLVVRSHSNQISIRFRGDRGQGRSGSLLLRYQAFVLSCAFPRRPPGGDVSVSQLQAGGEAFFVCSSGYRLLGPEVLTCRNATTPYWSGKEPTCV